MKLQALIQELQSIYNKEGDIPVYLEDESMGEPEIYEVTELLERKDRGGSFLVFK